MPQPVDLVPLGCRALEVAIGVIGPDDLVHRVLAVGRRLRPGQGWRLLPTTYRSEGEAPDHVRRLQGSADVYLFTGPVPYDLCRREGVLDRPAVFIPLDGTALYRALLLAALDGGCDIGRLSIDTLPRTHVEEAYAELGLSSEGLRVWEYAGPQPARAIAEWHERLWRDGTVTAAASCIRSVYDLLRQRDVPALRVVPTGHAIRTALQTAILAATGSRLEQSRIAICLVDVDGFEHIVRQSPSPYWIQELKLRLQHVLLQEARTMGATLVPLGNDDFMVLTTWGALRAATDGLRRAPFLEPVGRELALTLSVGIGLGRSASEAEARAQDALGQARALGGDGAVVLGEDGRLLAMLGRHADEAPAEAAITTGPVGDGQMDHGAALRPSPSLHPAEIAKRLWRSLVPGDHLDGSGPVVDAQTVARSLAVSPRTARRLLQRLVREGLAYPVAPGRHDRRGRPSHRYRLVLSAEARPDAATAWPSP